MGNLIMFVAMCIFGLNIPINKFIYEAKALDPMAVTLLRMSFAAFMFWLVSLFLPKEKVTKKDLLILMVGGILGMAMNQGFFGYGLSRTAPVDAAIIATSGPLFAMVIAAIVLHEPITGKKVSGVLVGAVGALVLVLTSAHTEGSNSSWQGNLAVMVAQCCYATYLVITKPLADKYSAITVMKWMFLFSAIVMFPVGIKDVINAPIFQLENQEMYFVALAFILFGSTFIAYMLIPMAQRRIRPTTIAMYNNLQPLIASAVAISVGMDHFTITKLVAAVFIFGGVYLVTISKSKADMEVEKESTETDLI